MTTKYLLPLLAFLGALFGLFIVQFTQKEYPVAPILFPPPVPPYAHFIAGQGIIEASSQNIAIGSPYNEIIREVYVVEGDDVKVGDPLFKLDTQIFEAQLLATKANIQSAKTTLEDRKAQFAFYQRLKDSRAVTEQIFTQTNYALKEAEESLKIAEANLVQVEVSIERSTVRSPIDGKILQVNLHIGEIAPVLPTTSSQSNWRTVDQGTLMLLGNVNPLQVRIDVDEEQCWRYESGSKATAFVRGNSFINFPLEFVRIEPYIIPKSSFTGQTVERVDTRVLQLLYNFERGDIPVYAGQVLDIFIEAKPFEAMIPK